MNNNNFANLNMKVIVGYHCYLKRKIKKEALRGRNKVHLMS